MSYTQRLSTSLGPGRAYIHSARDPGTLTPTADVFEGVWERALALNPEIVWGGDMTGNEY